MLNSPDDVEKGRIVHLYPHTKQASRNCHRLLTVSVMKNPAQHWPYLIVCWKEDGQDLWEKVHKDNIRVKSAAASTKADVRQGDSVGEGQRRGAKPGRVRVMPKQPKAVIDPDQGEQLELF